MLNLQPTTAYLVLLIAVLPLCIWVCWSDLRAMRIPNWTVYALAGIWLVVGLVVVPLEPWAWRWLNLVVVLVLGLILNAIAHVGAGDAKFAAAAAPFFRAADAIWVLPLFSAFLLGAFAAHRMLRAIPAVRAATPTWVSWTSAKFPMGLALCGTLIAYLVIMAFELQDDLLMLTRM